MPVIQPPPVSKQLQDEIHKAELMHDFISATIPDKFVGDTDQKILVAAIYSLTSEHHGAILHLLKTGRFDGSALALVRPLIDGAYRLTGYILAPSRILLHASRTARTSIRG